MRWRSSNHAVLLLMLFFSLCTQLAGRVSGFRICSYNVQKFSPKKVANHRMLLHTLTRVLSRCDISLLQDVVDADGKAVQSLLNKLNRYDEYQYQAVSSKSLGKSAADMQKYVFIYRTQTVSVTGQHQHQSKLQFVRAPFVVQFQSDKTTIKKFILVPLHSDPDQAIQEIDWLYEVFTEVSEKWNNTNVMFLGDFHASCAYVTRSDRKKIRLYTNSSFSWLIGDRVDTTVTDNTSCAYDRIVVHGQPFLKAIRPLSAQVFNLGKHFKLSKSAVLRVSDHFPVEVMLKSSAPLRQATPLLLLAASVIVWLYPEL